MTVTNDIKTLENAFDILNRQFYNGELPKPVIQFYADTKEKAYGWITRDDVWSANGTKAKEINICANFARRNMYNIYATLLHEMAHLYNLEHGIQDTTSNNYYHNKRFKETAEAHGLVIERDKKYGWSVTSLNDEARTVVDNLLNNTKLDMSYTLPPKGKKTKKKQNSFKHVCPTCGAIARTSKDGMHLICGDCMEPMVQED